MLLSVLQMVQIFSTRGYIENSMNLLLKKSKRFSEAMKALSWLARSKGYVQMTCYQHLSDPKECKEKGGGKSGLLYHNFFL